MYQIFVSHNAITTVYVIGPYYNKLIKNISTKPHSYLEVSDSDSNCFIKTVYHTCDRMWQIIKQKNIKYKISASKINGLVYINVLNSKRHKTSRPAM